MTLNQAQFEEELTKKVQEVEACISRYLPAPEGFDQTVIEAMRYSFLAGGKRLRPLLMQEVFHLFGGEGERIAPCMAALEMIHTYSLIHDDLPAMDNDAYRRGRKTTHIVYGEAMAILAGDGLLTYAFETAAKAMQMPGADAARVLRCITILAQKAGMGGMLSGQCVDVEAEKKNLSVDLPKLMYIHDKKTAALIQAALCIGGCMAGADDAAMQILERIGYLVGVAFQIQDDILDVIGDEKELGKPIGSDEKNHKVTYVTLKGLAQAKQDAIDLSEEAIALCAKLPGDTAFLTALVEHLCYRTK